MPAKIQRVIIVQSRLRKPFCTFIGKNLRPKPKNEYRYELDNRFIFLSHAPPHGLQPTNECLGIVIICRKTDARDVVKQRSCRKNDNLLVEKCFLITISNVLTKLFFPFS